MKRGAKKLPVKASRDSLGTAPSAADGVSRQANNTDGDVCDDNELGTEWTGNLDCDDSTKNKQKRRLQNP